MRRKSCEPSERIIVVVPRGVAAAAAAPQEERGGEVGIRERFLGVSPFILRPFS